MLERLQENAVGKGVVKNLTDYGAFVDLGGIDGLLHITDMAWKRVRHPSEVVNVGDELDVRVLKYDKERNRVSLGLKQLGDDPWVAISRRYPVGSRLFGKVSNRSEEHTSELQSLMRISYAVFCLKKKKKQQTN